MAAAARACTHWPQTDRTCADGDRWWAASSVGWAPWPWPVPCSLLLT